jgi:hypothetical protein
MRVLVVPVRVLLIDPEVSIINMIFGGVGTIDKYNGAVSGSACDPCDNSTSSRLVKKVKDLRGTAAFMKNSSY